jgi:alpha-N-arabinofuranosidase
MMRMTDPTIELAACGSSGRKMATYGDWERIVLEHTFEHVEFISLHTYLNNYADDTPSFLASPDLMDSFIEEVVAIADSVAARRRSSKRIMLSFDEWNVWYRTRRGEHNRVQEGWPVAPPILEEEYNMQDALAFGGACISLLNHADRVKAGCLAQLVNAIAPIMTETGGPAWRQTIFWPFSDFSNLGRGRVLQARVDTPTYSTRYYEPTHTEDLYEKIDAVPYLKFSAVHSQADKTVTLFILNRHLSEEMQIDVAATGFGDLGLQRAHTLHHAELKASNTRNEPDKIVPRNLQGVEAQSSRTTVTVPPASWSVVRFETVA